ncbi:MAG: RagB/SusD family nutrient uptake outer membrane protein [Dysgonamonadaceae bacterium]|jgi:hypothetical protein|nr:RagB/SusD family nutrient uptake outer membrane protein [Dysgonamonadaceae bacterium]
MKTLLNIAISALLLLPCWSCSEDYLDTKPSTDASDGVVFKTTETAAQVINGIARLMGLSASTGIYSQDICGAEGSIKYSYGNAPGNTVTSWGVSTYGFTVNKAAGNMHQNNNHESDSFPWWHYYRLVSNANSVIANIDEAEGPLSEKQRIKAQALVFRAYAYTMLVQLYAYRWTDSNNGATPSVVLRLKPGNEPMPLASLAGAYRQIYADLDEAIDLFTASGWARPANDFWSPNINVAYATYARAAINKLDYEKAIQMAPKAREGYPLMTVNEYKSGFYSPNREWIWGSYQGSEQRQQWSGFHAYMGYNAYAATATAGGVKRIVKSYYEKIPNTDLRKTLFLNPVGYPENTFNSTDWSLPIDRQHPKGAVIADSLRKLFPNLSLPAEYPNDKFSAYMQLKFCINPTSTTSDNVGNLNHFRSSEMYLIEAEAQYKLGNENAARNALITLTKDSGRNPQYACTKTGDELLEEIKFLSQIELWGEGFDWFMTKRWGDRIVHTAISQGGSYLEAFHGEWGPEDQNKQTWMVPLLETDYNPLAKTVDN